MLKKSKSDSPKPEKVKKDKPAKPDKPEKAGGAKRQDYFWEKWQKNRKKGAGGMPMREKAMPTVPTSKEDKLKLIGCAAIVIAIPIVILIVRAVQSAHPAVTPK